MRVPKSKQGPWSVVKVNDNGQRIVYKRGLSEEYAFELAGWMRDKMPDADVGKGWNYEPRFRARNSPTPPVLGATTRRKVVR